jgi:MiaB/RimO family radical SAM methylthiotransferase
MFCYISRRLAQAIVTTTKRLSSSTNPGPDLKHFLRQATDEVNKSRHKVGVTRRIEPLCSCDDSNELMVCSKSEKCQYRVNQVPVFIRTYGCQMNESDTSVVASILQDYGYRIVSDESEAKIELLMTCAIRESAENKIWAKLRGLKKRKDNPCDPLEQVGLLGCMAERLKEKVLETDNSVDIVAGPDAYRDLPKLFAANRLTNEKAINCLLSFDETYSDIRPVTSINDVTSFISITRGCDNLCSYCIVPFTRGRERSRPLPTILDEVKYLLSKGVKEVTLLGQNVNSYRDVHTPPQEVGRPDLSESIKAKESPAEGFKTVYRPRQRGITFDVLLEEVAKITPELRIRFTSPHPKDFTDDVIHVMSKYPNIARCIHLPAQSGSNSVLKKMRRGYTRESYLNLVDKIKSAIPDIAITSDFIVGFCGETDEDHDLTVDLIKKVEYNFVYVFPYSERTKTTAYHRYDDDVPHQTKIERVMEIYSIFRSQAAELNRKLINTTCLVLIESDSSKSPDDWQGRIDQNTKTILPKRNVIDTETNQLRPIRPGDYVACKILEANAQTLKAEPLYITTQARNYFDLNNVEIKQVNR